MEAVASAEEFELLLATATSDMILVVKWGASWCGPCRRMAPIFDRLSGEYSDADDITWLSVDTDALKGLAAQHSITRLPSFTFHCDGKQIGFLSGCSDEAALRQEVQRLVAEREERLVAAAVALSVAAD